MKKILIFVLLMIVVGVNAAQLGVQYDSATRIVSPTNMVFQGPIKFSLSNAFDEGSFLLPSRTNWVNDVVVKHNLIVPDGNIQIGDGSSFGGYVSFSNEVGMLFHISQAGPIYGGNVAGINYRYIINETISTGLLHRANAYIWEDDLADWMMSLDIHGLAVGTPAGVAPPNTLSMLEVYGGAAIGQANARTVAAPANGLRVQGKVQIGTVGDVDFGQLTVSPSTSVDNYATVTIGDTASATNRAGIYIRSTLPGTAGISSAGTPIAFFQGGPGVSETARLVRDVGLGVFTTSPAATIDTTGSVAAVSGRFTNTVTIGTGTANGRLTVSNTTPTTPSFAVYGSNNPTPQFIILSNGNAGFGASAPLASMEVFGPNSTISKFTRDLATDVGLSVGADNSGVQLATIGVHEMQFLFSSVQKATMNANGFGFGTTIPSSSIDATGQVRGASAIFTNSVSILATNGPAAPASTSFSTSFGAHLWTDGTNLCVVMQNGAGTRTTNKLSMTAWP